MSGINKPLSVLSFMLMSLSVNAQHFDPGVLTLLSEMNTGKAVGNETQRTCDLADTEITSNRVTNSRDMNECVVALCGVPSENKSVYLTNSNFDKYVSKDLKKKITAMDPKLNKLFDKIQANQLKVVADLEAKILKNGVAQASSDTWTDSFKGNLSKAIFEPYMDITVNSKRLGSDRLKIKINTPQEASSEFKTQLNQFAKSYEFYLKNDPFKLMESGIYSEAELIAIGTERLEKVKKIYDDNKSLFTPEAQKTYELNLKSIDETTKQATGANSMILLSSLMTLEDIVSEKVPDLKKRRQIPDCENSIEDKLSCTNLYQEYFNKKNLAGQLADFKKDLMDPKVRERSMLSCKAQILANATTSSDKKIALKLVEDVKKKMKANVFSKFSKHSSGILDQYFSKKILTSNGTLMSMIAEEDPLLKFTGKVDNYLASEDFSLPTSEEEALEKVLELSNDADNFDPFLNLASPCTNERSANAWDSYLAYDKLKQLPEEAKELLTKIPPKDHLFISDFSCNHDLRGQSVVAHELGHAINQIFATTKLSVESLKFYQSLRQCATGAYTDFIADRTMFAQPNDAIRTEEDTADLLAMMSYPSGHDLFSCALIKPSHNEKSYSDLAFIVEDGDSHSTPLFRLVTEAVNKGVSLPVSCQRALGPVKGKLRLKKCTP